MSISSTVPTMENTPPSWVNTGEVRVTNVSAIVSESLFSFDYFVVDNKMETVISVEVKVNRHGSSHMRSPRMFSVKPDMIIASSRCELESLFPTELELTYHETNPNIETSIITARASKRGLKLSDIILETGIAKVNPAKIEEFDRVSHLFMGGGSNYFIEDLKSAISCVNYELVKTGKKNNSDYKIEVDVSIDPEVKSWTNFPLVVKLREERVEKLLELWESLNFKCCPKKTSETLLFVDVVFWD